MSGTSGTTPERNTHSTPEQRNTPPLRGCSTFRSTSIPGGTRNKRSDRWKALEQTTAAALKGERVHRDWLAFESAPDVRIPDMNWLCECKAYARFSHHRLLETAQAKYASPGEQVVLVTREPGRQAYATLPLSLLAELVDAYRKARHEHP